MVQVHVLTKGFDSPNGRAFLFPLIKYRQDLLARGITWCLFSEVNQSLPECDVLIIESKFYKFSWGDNENRTLDEISNFRAAGPTVLFFDTGDSTGWLLSQVLPVVDGYRKSQLLKNRKDYLRPLYGNRPYTHHYFEHCAVKDTDPVWSRPILDEIHLRKLGLSWNSGLADYSLYGPLRMMMFKKFPWSGFLQFPSVKALPSQDRNTDLSCRFGIQYPRQSVAWQRCGIREKMGVRLSTNKLSRRRYFKELQDSKIVISPFGLGEITLKDFEVFLTGGLLLKPTMSHLETWPNLFRDGETLATFDWSLVDLDEQINSLLHDQDARINIAKQGQENYMHYLENETGSIAFCDHFMATLNTQTAL